MRRVQYIVIFVVALCGSALNGIAQNGQTGATPVDEVYTAKEVDRKAVITNRRELDPERLGAATDCRSGARVVVKAILRKSGQVTDINVIKAASCSLDEKAAKIVSYAKFKPAMKRGVPVSQYIDVTYEFRKH